MVIIGQDAMFHHYGVTDKVLSHNSKIFVFMYCNMHIRPPLGTGWYCFGVAWPLPSSSASNPLRNTSGSSSHTPETWAIKRAWLHIMDITYDFDVVQVSYPPYTLTHFGDTLIDPCVCETGIEQQTARDLFCFDRTETSSFYASYCICAMVWYALFGWFFLSFAHQIPRESTEIARSRGIQPSVMVVTWKYNDPTPFPLLPNASMHKGGV